MDTVLVCILVLFFMLLFSIFWNLVFIEKCYDLCCNYNRKSSNNYIEDGSADINYIDTTTSFNTQTNQRHNDSLQYFSNRQEISLNKALDNINVITSFPILQTLELREIPKTIPEQCEIQETETPL